MLDNSARHEYVGDDHAVIPKNRRRKGAFIPNASGKFRRMKTLARYSKGGVAQEVIKMSSEIEDQYSFMRFYYKAMGINYVFPNSWVPLSEEEKRQILALREQGITYKQIGEKINRSESAVEEVVKNFRKTAEIKNDRKQPPPVSEEEKRQILALREQGITYKQIGEKIGRNEDTVREVVKNFRKTAEIKNDRKLVPVSEEEKQRIFVLRQKGSSYEKIAEEIGRDENTVIKVVKIFEKEGVLSPSEYNKPLSEEQKKEILDLRSQGLGYKEIAERTGRSKATISRVMAKKFKNFPFFLLSLSLIVQTIQQ